MASESYLRFREGAQSGLFSSNTAEGEPYTKWSEHTRVLGYYLGLRYFLFLASHSSCLLTKLQCQFSLSYYTVKSEKVLIFVPSTLTSTLQHSTNHHLHYSSAIGTAYMYTNMVAVQIVMSKPHPLQRVYTHGLVKATNHYRHKLYTSQLTSGMHMESL